MNDPLDPAGLWAETGAGFAARITLWGRLFVRNSTPPGAGAATRAGSTTTAAGTSTGAGAAGTSTTGALTTGSTCVTGGGTGLKTGDRTSHRAEMDLARISSLKSVKCLSKSRSCETQPAASRTGTMQRRMIFFMLQALSKKQFVTRL